MKTRKFPFLAALLIPVLFLMTSLGFAIDRGSHESQEIAHAIKRALNVLTALDDLGDFPADFFSDPAVSEESVLAQSFSEALSSLLPLRYEEVESALLERLALKLKKHPSIEYVSYALRYFKENGTSRNVADLRRLVEQYLGYLEGKFSYQRKVDTPAYSKLHKLSLQLQETVGLMQQRTDPLPRLTEDRNPLLPGNGMGFIPYLAKKTEREKLHDFKKYLEAHFKGQPEVVMELYLLEWQNRMYGYTRAKPKILTFMGLKGTGKDTGAQTYVDAMYGRKDAWLEHMFSLPVINDQASLTSLSGSAPGLVSSDDIPALHKFLVKHSGGRYQIMEARDQAGKKTQYIVQNEEWRPGRLIEGEPPERAVIFINEFHNWSKKAKDDGLKQALERGYFDIRNPGAGVPRLIVPVTFIIGTNEGTGLLVPREANGQRIGKPVTYEYIMEKWEEFHGKPDVLKQEMFKTSGANGQFMGEYTPGTSEETANRLPNNTLLLFRPLSPAVIREVVQEKLMEMRARLGSPNPEFQIGDMEIKWKPGLVEFVRTFKALAEDNARPVVDNIEYLIENTFLKGLAEETIPSTSERQTYTLDVERNPDNTSSLVIEHQDRVGVATTSRVLIHQTLSEAERHPLTDEQLDELFKLEGLLNTSVFGAKDVINRLAKAIVITEEGRNRHLDIHNATEPARAFLFLGLSSVGKTEIAKAVARHHFKDPNRVRTFDFSQVDSMEKIEQMILGKKDSMGNVIPSTFMQDYDRFGGRVVFVLDEMPNAAPQLMNTLLDLLREPVVNTFADHVPRVMSNVIILMNGNLSQEWYDKVPRNIPVEQQQVAEQEIHKMATSDEDFMRNTLLTKFPAPLINRIDMRNIFFFGPLDFGAVRELAQSKLVDALKRLEPTEGRRGWKIKFKDQGEYVKMLQAIEEDGFIFREQGASIDHFVKNEVERELRYLLLQNRVPTGAEVHVSRLSDEKGAKRHEGGALRFQIAVVGGKTLELKIPKRPPKEYLANTQKSQRLTSYHEAGHEFVRHVLFGDRFKSTRISIIPGVAFMETGAVTFAGIAQFSQTESFETTRDVVIGLAAVWAAGYTAQTVVTAQGVHDEGKSNDMERATQLIQTGILHYGLSKKWGKSAIPADMPLDKAIASLSEKRRRLLEEEVGSWLREAESLARWILLLHFKTVFVPLGNELGKRGEMDDKEIERFYTKHEKFIQHQKFGQGRRGLSGLADWLERKSLESSNWMARTRTLLSVAGSKLEYTLLPDMAKAGTLADIREIVRKRKTGALAKVPLDPNIPLAEPPASHAADCLGPILRAGPS